jgi:hypothetical protein
MSDPHQSDVADAVAAARAGDEGAWARLVLRFRRRVLALLHGRIADPATVDDLAQETFVVVYRRRDCIGKPRRVGSQARPRQGVAVPCHGADRQWEAFAGRFTTPAVETVPQG